MLAGIGGFIPFLTPAAPLDAQVVTLDKAYGFLFGLFPVNAAHDVLHIIFGLWGVLSAKHRAAVWYCRIVAVVYAVLIVLGAIPITNTLFGIAPMYGHDLWLHGIVALVTLSGGWGAPSQEPMEPFKADAATLPPR